MLSINAEKVIDLVMNALQNAEEMNATEDTNEYILLMETLRSEIDTRIIGAKHLLREERSN